MFHYKIVLKGTGKNKSIPYPVLILITTIFLNIKKNLGSPDGILIAKFIYTNTINCLLKNPQVIYEKVHQHLEVVI